VNQAAFEAVKAALAEIKSRCDLPQPALSTVCTEWQATPFFATAFATIHIEYLLLYN